MNDIKQLSNQEISTFFTQTAILFQAGIPPFESMSILLNDCKTESGKAVLQSIQEICRTGEPFSVAIKESGCFPEYVVSMVTLGEETGKLDTCMLSLADYYEKEDAISENIKSAISYPLVMIILMLVVIIVLISKVMPIFQQVFAELGSELTGFGATMLRVGTALNRYSIVLLLIMVIAAGLYFASRHTNRGRQLTKSLLLKFPLTRSFYDSVAKERFASSMAMATASGMDYFEGLDMAKALVENDDIAEKIDKCKQLLNEGNNFAESLTNAGIFGNLHAQMISIGFRSGNVEDVLLRIADNFEKETNRKIHNILGVLEPSLVIILSVIVGMILLSVILPLMGIMSNIG